MHGRYGAGKRKRKPRYTREEVRGWEDQTKRENYQNQRNEVKVNFFYS